MSDHKSTYNDAVGIKADPDSDAVRGAGLFLGRDTSLCATPNGEVFAALVQFFNKLVEVTIDSRLPALQPDANVTRLNDEGGNNTARPEIACSQCTNSALISRRRSDEDQDVPDSDNGVPEGMGIREFEAKLGSYSASAPFTSPIEKRAVSRPSLSRTNASLHASSGGFSRQTTSIEANPNEEFTSQSDLSIPQSDTEPTVSTAKSDTELADQLAALLLCRDNIHTDKLLLRRGFRQQAADDLTQDRYKVETPRTTCYRVFSREDHWASPFPPQPNGDMKPRGAAWAAPSWDSAIGCLTWQHVVTPFIPISTDYEAALRYACDRRKKGVRSVRIVEVDTRGINLPILDAWTIARDAGFQRREDSRNPRRCLEHHENEYLWYGTIPKERIKPMRSAFGQSTW